MKIYRNRCFLTGNLKGAKRLYKPSSPELKQTWFSYRVPLKQRQNECPIYHLNIDNCNILRSWRINGLPKLPKYSFTNHKSYFIRMMNIHNHWELTSRQYKLRRSSSKSIQQTPTKSVLHHSFFGIEWSLLIWKIFNIKK